MSYYHSSRSYSPSSPRYTPEPCPFRHILFIDGKDARSKFESLHPTHEDKCFMAKLISEDYVFKEKEEYEIELQPIQAMISGQRLFESHDRLIRGEYRKDMAVYNVSNFDEFNFQERGTYEDWKYKQGVMKQPYDLLVKGKADAESALQLAEKCWGDLIAVFNVERDHLCRAQGVDPTKPSAMRTKIIRDIGEANADEYYKKKNAKVLARANLDAATRALQVKIAEDQKLGIKRSAPGKSENRVDEESCTMDLEATGDI